MTVSSHEWFFLDCLNLNLQSFTMPGTTQPTTKCHFSERWILIILVHYAHACAHTHTHTHTQTIFQSKKWCAMKHTVEAALTTYSLSQVVPSNESCLIHYHFSGDIQALCYNLEGHGSISNAVKGTFDLILPAALWAWHPLRIQLKWVSCTIYSQI